MRSTFDEKEKARTLEMLHYQLAEIKEVRPKPGEEDTLLDQKQKLKHGERIQKQTAFAYRALRGAEKGNALYILDRAAVALRQLTDVLPQAAGVAEKLDEAMALAEEAADQVETMQEEVEGNPEALLDQVESRLAAIDRLKRKYGSTVEEILRFEAEAKERLSLYEGADEEIALLKETGRAVRRRVAEKAQAIHDKRTEAAAALSGKVTEMLHYLDMPKAVFCMDVLPRPQGEAQYDAYGGDDILFRIAANPGEEPLPIEKAASGGELARIMLAIRSQLCEQNGIDTVVYDEVDAGVSGKTARKIGYLMQKSAAEGQILCVTHSAQIASLATEHLLVYKTERNGRAESFVRSLAWDERVEELSRILGGIHVTEAQRMATTDMLSGKE